MRNFYWLIFFLIACGEKTEEKAFSGYVPELAIADSLVIDHLTTLGMLDVKEDHSEYLMYDFKTNEFFRVDESGEILIQVNRSKDGKDSYKQRFFLTANYFGIDQILIVTSTSAFIYDLEFNLIEEKKLDFELVTRRIGGSRALMPFADYLFTFSFEISDAKSFKESDDFSISYPFMTVRDINTFAVLNNDSVPAQSQMALSPGMYNNLDPIVKLVGQELYVLFPHSPEMYVYEFPDLKLKRSFELEPGDDYKQISPTKDDKSFEGFINALGSSEYMNFVFSNGYLLTQFSGYVPQDLIDELPRDYVGGPEYGDLTKTYKYPLNYQIFKDEEKIWQGKWDVNLWSVRDVIFSVAKPGEDPDAVEKDVQTFYFYELR